MSDGSTDYLLYLLPNSAVVDSPGSKIGVNTPTLAVSPVGKGFEGIPGYSSSFPCSCLLPPYIPVHPDLEGKSLGPVCGEFSPLMLHPLAECLPCKNSIQSAFSFSICNCFQDPTWDLHGSTFLFYSFLFLPGCGAPKYSGECSLFGELLQSTPVTSLATLPKQRFSCLPFRVGNLLRQMSFSRNPMFPRLFYHLNPIDVASRSPE